MVTDDELRAALAAAMTGFAAEVDAIVGDEWDRPSMCDGWSIHDVVDHVLAGDRFAAVILAGGSYDDGVAAVVGVDHIGADAGSATRRLAAGARNAFAAPLDRIVDHPVGQIPARRFIGFRVLDQLGHTWDVGAALDRPPTLDPNAVRVALDVCEAERDMLDASTHFAMPPADELEGGDPQETFLRSIGRTP